MTLNTDLFQKTTEGKHLQKLLENGIMLASGKNHVLGHEHKRIKNEKANKFLWRCIDCDASLEMDFMAGKVKGSALKNECPGRQWESLIDPATLEEEKSKF